MTRAVATPGVDLDLVGAAERFLASQYRRFPVPLDGKLVGQISHTDVLRALIENCSAWGNVRAGGTRDGQQAPSQRISAS
ncbi:MAG: hypothetical protein C0524_10560 [Rhodobacter sp.]|nr:hypothetical protein [Rhodobacter sp.]